MSLTRILEPEVMDSWDDAREYDSMDHREVNLKFVDDLLAAGECVGDVLDLGTGTAQIPVVLCAKAKDCRIMAVDLAASMLDLARYNIEAAGVVGRVQLAQCDAKGLPQRAATFDLVMSNSIVHHVPEPRTCLSEAVRVTKPGGRLFFRDLMRPETQEQLDDLVETYAGTSTEYQKRMFRESLHAALSLEEIRNLVAALGFDPSSVQASSDRHWTWNAIKS